jgi:hypothetical protein
MPLLSAGLVTQSLMKTAVALTKLNRMGEVPLPRPALTARSANRRLSLAFNLASLKVILEEA